MKKNVIPADILINETIVRKVVSDQFGLSPKTIQCYGEGWDTFVYLLDNHLIFRFPRRKEAIPCIKREMKILPILASKISLKIPKPLYFGRATSSFNRPFYGHEIIPGIPESTGSFSLTDYGHAAIDLANFLKELHSINPQVIASKVHIEAPTFDRCDFEKSINKFNHRLKSIKKVYDLKPYLRKISDICNDASSYTSENSWPTIVHGDLYHRHLLFGDNKRLVGVIDWGDCGLADPVADLGIVFLFLPKAFHRDFFELYGIVSDHALLMARFIGLYYAVALLWFGTDRTDESLIKTSLWTLAEI